MDKLSSKQLELIKHMQDGGLDYALDMSGIDRKYGLALIAKARKIMNVKTNEELMAGESNHKPVLEKKALQFSAVDRFRHAHPPATPKAKDERVEILARELYVAWLNPFAEELSEAYRERFILACKEAAKDFYRVMEQK